MSFKDEDMFGHRFPCLEKLWLWEGNLSWATDWEVEYRHYDQVGEVEMFDELEAFFDDEKRFDSVFEAKEVKVHDLKLIWYRKDTTGPCANCGSHQHN